MAVKTCNNPNCSNGIAKDSDANLCLYCQSRLTNCKIGARTSIKDEKGFSSWVPWCTHFDKRLMNVDCENCEHYSEEKMLPSEVGE